MKLPQRIPTILGIIIICLSLGATIILFKNIRSLLSQAAPNTTPLEVKITNLNDSNFSVSWITNSKVSGTVNYGTESSLGNIAADDRDQTANQTNQYLTHHVTLRYLKPVTKYYFKIISEGASFDHNGEPYIVTTAPQAELPNSGAQPAYGTVINAYGKPAVDAIVYLTIPGATLQSTVVKTTGNWLVTLNNVRTSDLSGFIKITGTEKIDILVQAGADGTATATTDIAHTSPVPQITLGQNQNFVSSAGLTPSLSPSPVSSSSPLPTGTILPTSSPTSGSSNFTIPPITYTPSLTSPATGSAIPSDRPIITGTGVPGQTVTIKIESANPVSGTATVDANGNWHWTPPTGLPPGEHTVTVSTTDTTGKTIQLIHTFIVLASGTQVVEAATPSASTRPSPTPTAIPSPTPTPSVATGPATGNLTPTIFLILLGLTFIAIGFSKLFMFKASTSI